MCYQNAWMKSRENFDSPRIKKLRDEGSPERQLLLGGSLRGRAVGSYGAAALASGGSDTAKLLAGNAFSRQRFQQATLSAGNAFSRQRFQQATLSAGNAFSLR
jgi:hypothetical protein